MISQFSCDRTECDTKQGLTHHHDYIPDGWFLVRDDDDRDFHFCSKDCLMFWASKSAPMETIPANWASLASYFDKPGPKITLCDEQLRPIIDEATWDEEIEPPEEDNP